jgi:hypothetical protein
MTAYEYGEMYEYEKKLGSDKALAIKTLSGIVYWAG